VPKVLAAIVREVVARQHAHIIVANGNWERIVRETLRAHQVPLRRVRFFHLRTNECWCRDHGPAFVVRTRRGRRELAIVDWGFNAWGGKYPPWEDDDEVPSGVAAALGLPVFYPGIVMEGGAVEFNGAGTVMTTTSCLLNRNRNPGLSRRDIEGYLKAYYGQRHVVWLGEGIAGDDTDGHIDDLARFLDPRTVVTAVEPDPADPNHRVLVENLRRLEAARDQDGRSFEVVTVPMPSPVLHEGERLPATYLNFLFVNGAVLVPTFGDRRRDREALGRLRTALPRHEVVGINCRDLVWGLGAIHCLTQQQPVGG
jgi:agmatine deiminase